MLFEHGSYGTFRPFGWTQLGAHGVEIFFVISGYLITGKLLEDGSLSKFYVRRVFRILPVLFAYLAVLMGLGFALHRIPLAGSEIAASFLFVRNYCNFSSMSVDGSGWFTGHLWSLSIEEQFYLVWPVMLLKVGRGALRRQLLAAMLLFGFGCSLLAVVMTGRFFHWGGWHWLPNIKFGGLVLGCVLRIAFSGQRGAAVIRTIFSGRCLPAVGLAAVYFAVFHSRVTIFDPLICAAAVCSTLVNPTSWIGKLLEISALRWIGRLSYSLYLWQQLFLGFGPVDRPFGRLSSFPLNFVLLLAAASASYYLLERPMMRLGHHLAKSRSMPSSNSTIEAAA